MSFLQINNPNGTSGVKRPFRLSDIQDIWDGITSLFKPIKGELFRIISGFNLAGDTYSAGAVYYNGHIYEYDGSKPITASTSATYFAKIAIATRQFEDGNSYPFAYKYVCGGSSFASESGFISQTGYEQFRVNIPKYKSYLGTGSVTTEKLADESVTSEKLANSSVGFSKIEPTQRQVYTGDSDIEVLDSSAYVALDYLVANAPVIRGVTMRGAATLKIRIDSDLQLDYPIIPIHVRNNNTSSSVSVKLVLYVDGVARAESTSSVAIPVNTEKTILLARGGSLVGYTFTDGYSTVSTL